MALVNVVNMAVLDNPAPFTSSFSFEITFECLQPLSDDLEWKVLYVGSAEDTSHDQVLDEILVGPIPVGINKFVLQADAPDTTQIPERDILGVTVVLVTCSYREKEFVRVGYYVNNEYTEVKDPHSALDIHKVRRIVLSDKPRVTRFPIKWGDKEEEAPQQGTTTSLESKEDQGQAQQSMESQMLEDAKSMAVNARRNVEDALIDDDLGDDELSIEGAQMEDQGDVMMDDAPEMSDRVVSIAVE